MVKCVPWIWALQGINQVTYPDSIYTNNYVVDATPIRCFFSMVNRMLRCLPVIFIISVFLSGCATTAQSFNNDSDPLERYNRAVFEFNRKVDEAVLKPLAEGYKAIAPEPVDEGVTNFFSNLGDVVIIANDLMQLKLEQAAMDTGRVALNSTLGLLGIIDVATAMGFPKNNEDFGQTLGYWGVDEGYYLVLPFLGPTTTRDIWRLPVDYWFYPVSYVEPFTDRMLLRGAELIDFRADLLQASKVLDEAALDPYTFLREAYLQRRRSLVSDGDFAEEDEPDLFDELDEESDSESKQ